jgi:hypothetical protein
MFGSEKPYAESCDQNKGPILAVLREVFTEPGTILEIGSGTGQHAVYFAAQLEHLVWQPTDVAAHLPGIAAWLEDAGLPNLRVPLALDVSLDTWPVHQADGVFSANTVHIMSWPEVEHMFRGLGRIMAPGAPLCLYGPFNYGGHYTSQSNERFDQCLKARDARSGIRDFDDLNRLADVEGLELVSDYPMPANNRTLVWRKR